MEKINKQTVLDYIGGSDIDGYDIEALEGNKQFMMDVLSITKDKRMYKMCSDELKRDYEFTKFVIETFQDDIGFISQIADAYLNRKKETNSNQDIMDITSFELTVLMRNIWDKTRDDSLMKYAVNAVATYEDFMVEVAAFKISKENSDLQGISDLDFMFVTSAFGTSKIIMDFFAQKIVENALYNNEEYSFEEIIHLNFKTIGELKKQGETSFFVNCIRGKDAFLAEYLQENPSLLSGVKQSLKAVEKNWSSYLNRINREKVEMVCEEASKYFDSNCENMHINYQLALEQIMESQNLGEVFRKHVGLSGCDEDDYSDEDYDYAAEYDYSFEDEASQELDELYYEKDIQMTNDIGDLEYINHMKKYVRMLFKEDVPYREREQVDKKEETEQDDTAHEVIHYDFKNRRIISVETSEPKKR